MLLRWSAGVNLDLMNWSFFWFQLTESHETSSKQEDVGSLFDNARNIVNLATLCMTW